jgi:hypothetical protein
MLAGNTVFDAGSFEQISTVLVQTATNSIVFSAIPQTYKHLQLRMTIRGTASSNSANIAMAFNGPDSSSWVQHFMWGNGTNVQSFANTGLTTWVNNGIFPSGNAPASVFGVSIIDILDYSASNKNKTVKILSGYNGSDNRIELRSGLYMNTAVVSHIQFSPWDNPNFAAGSRISLYGIKG